MCPRCFRLKHSDSGTAGGRCHAPDFLDVELGNIVWKKARRGELTRVEADQVLAQLPPLLVSRHPAGPLVLAAYDRADRTGRTVYDCLYLALAVQLGGQMVTADDRLAHALAGTAWAGQVLRVQDVP